MTTHNAQPSSLSPLLAQVRGGDTVVLAPGAYGDITIKRQAFAKPLRLVSDPARPAIFRSLNVTEAEGIELSGVSFRMRPTAATVAGTPVVYLNKSKRISILGGEVTSGPAVNGVPQEAAKLDKTENVIGWSTCHGVTVLTCEDILIEGVELHHLFRGSNVGGSRRITFRGNKIHHLRKSAIVGGGDDILIEGNRLHSARPWRYGETKYLGDHGDWIALWNGGKTPNRNIVIRNNRMWTGDGVPMMGGWLQGKAGKIIGFEYSGNLIVGGDHQGFVVSDAEDGLITHNVFLQDRDGGKPIGIIVGDRSARVTVRENLVGSASDKAKGALGSVLADNRIVEPLKRAKARAAAASDPFGSLIATEGDVYPHALKLLFPGVPTRKYPSRRAAFEAWDQKVAEMGETVDFLRAGEA